MPPIKPVPANAVDIPPSELRAAMQQLSAGLNPIEHMECAVLLLATCDLRPREALALTWADVDLGSRAIHVTRSCDDLGRPAPAKTVRVAEIPPATCDALEKRQAVQGRYFARYAPRLLAQGGSTLPEPDSPVVSTPEGAPVRPKSLSRWWHDKRCDFGLFGWTLADLRRARMAVEALDAEAGR